MAKQQKLSKIQKAKLAKERLEAGLKSVQTALEGIQTLSRELPNIAMFLVGYYGSFGKIQHRAIGGAKAVIGYQLARAPNIVAGGAGMAWTAATFVTAGQKAAGTLRK